MPLLALPENEVHLWYVRLEDTQAPDLLRAYLDLLSVEERARLDRFRRLEGQQEYLVTRALVRTVLSRYVAVDPRAWMFALNPHGRPDIAAPVAGRLLAFNLSHSNGVTACAVARQPEIGVDVEYVERRNNVEEIAQRYFSPAEVQALQAAPAANRRDRFFDFWTLKEAYIKARGMGLALPLDQFSFALSAGQPIRISFAPELRDDPTSWQFAQFSLTPHHRAAVAIRRGARPDLRIALRQTVPLGGDNLSDQTVRRV